MNKKKPFYCLVTYKVLKNLTIYTVLKNAMNLFIINCNKSSIDNIRY